MKRLYERLGFLKLSGLLAAVALAAIVLFLLYLRYRHPAEHLREAGLNVLLITVDTLRADAPGYAGNTNVRTPTVDGLASAGARFTRAYAHNTITLPSHANILSGRLPFVHGVRDNGSARFPTNVDTLATILKRSGYRTGAFVSAFPLDSRFGLARGFDTYDDQFSDTPGPAFLEQERPGSQTVARARQWMASSGSSPFFCWVHIYEPHFPYDPDYASDVTASDAALAPLLQQILHEGAGGRTLVIFTSDHGESLGEHGEATHGIFAYDATLRVPLVLYAPRLWRARAIETPAFHVDLLPTVLDALSLQVPPGLDGQSLLPAFKQPPESDRPLYFEAMSGMLNRGWAPLRGVVRDQLKYIELPLPELYDLRQDPREQHNLVNDRRDDVRRLRALLASWPDAARPPTLTAQSAETRERLRSLGYVTSASAAKTSYTEADDPKRLIDLDTLMQDVVTRYLAQDLAGALERCRELVARRPNMMVSLIYLAQLSRETGDLPGGIDALRKALSLNPADSQTAALLASYLTDAGRAPEASTLLEPFARAPEPDPQVLMAQGLAFARAGRPQDGLAVLERARNADRSNGNVLVHIGTIQLMSGHAPEATRSFEQALALNPALPRAHSSLAAIAAERGDAGGALAHWRDAVALDPAEFRTVLAVSISLVQRGRASDARPYFEFFAASAPASRYGPDIARARAWLRGDAR